jgi:hypothetical protein
VNGSGVKVTGGWEMYANLRALAARAPKALERAVYRFAEIEITEMKRLVPVDTGTLRASGYVEKPRRTGNTITVELGFGGAAEDYAIPVHEDLEAFHRVGQAKYVEQPLYESAAFFAQRIAESVRQSLGM